MVIVPPTVFSQQPGPWNNDLVICTSSDGTTFTNFRLFQDSSGVPSITRLPSGRLVAAFQWFPGPAFSNPHFDRVAVKFSDDNGNSWTPPLPIVIADLPAGYQRPFDPTVVATTDGRIRMYFSSSERMAMSGLDSLVNTYSAISHDGIAYSFESGPRFDQPTRPVIDPSALLINGVWHYTAPKGAPQDGAYHAISDNGLEFTRQPDIPSDNAHNWTGNLVQDSPTTMRFYGTGSPGNLWWAQSSDGIAWTAYTPTNVRGGDPGIVIESSGIYVMVFVSMGNFTTGVEASPPSNNIFSVYPNPSQGAVTVITGTEQVRTVIISDIAGRVITRSRSSGTFQCNVLRDGIYFVRVVAPNGEVTDQQLLVIRK